MEEKKRTTKDKALMTALKRREKMMVLLGLKAGFWVEVDLH